MSVRALMIAVIGLLATGSSSAGQEPPETLPAGAKRVVLDLRYLIEDVDIKILETPEEVRLTLTADILFDFDKASIKPIAHDMLRTVAAEILKRPGVVVRIEGHTDAKGSDAYNQDLSEQRAEAVRAWLAEQAQMDAVEFETRGFGATQPAVPNTLSDGGDAPLGRQRNRRVEIVLASA